VLFNHTNSYRSSKKFSRLLPGTRKPLKLSLLDTDHDTGGSTTILEYEAGRLVGIVTIQWHSHYPPFRDCGIPLIQNIEIRYHQRGRGLGNALLERAEQEIAQRSPIAGLCVGIFDEYGRGQRLYIKRAYNMTHTCSIKQIAL
jgi:hypothetical protein